MTNTTPQEDPVVEKWYYTNYSIGILSMFIAYLAPFLLPFLGSFIAPFLFLAGVFAVIISKKKWWLILLTLLVFTLPLLLFWQEYEILVYTFLLDTNHPES